MRCRPSWTRYWRSSNIARRAATRWTIGPRAALAEYIGELRALGDFSCALPEALRFVRERVQSLTVAPERPRPGHLYACSLSQSGYAGRAHLFIVGLEEGRVFAGSTEDPVLLDEERARISEDLKRSTDRIDEAVYGVLSRLAVSGAHATFSYSCRDTREFRETFASWLMLQAYRLQQGNEALSYQEMKKALGEPKSAVPADRDAGLSASAWWLRSIAGTGEDGASAVDAAFPNVARGRLAEGQRDGATFTEFDGYVPQAGPALDPCAPGNVYSVTELEKAAECPFRFFLKRGLGLRPVDERERDRDVWLDPLTRGSELHDVYAALLRKVRDEKRRPTLKDADWLLEVRAGPVGAARRRDAGAHAGDSRARDEGLPGRCAVVRRGGGRRRGHHSRWSRGVVWPAAGWRRGTARAFGAGGDQSWQRHDSQDRGTDRPHQRSGSGHVRGTGLQDRRLLARQLEGRLRRRASPAARALRAGRSRTAEGPPQEAEGARRGLLLLQPQRTGRARSNRGPCARVGRCRAGRPARSDYQRPLHPDQRTRTTAGTATSLPPAETERTPRRRAKLADAKGDAFRRLANHA